MDFFSSLNKEQLEAVRHEKGPLLILAGAGSGKTRVITYRIARLIKECGVSPYNILAITFTNKAANEMQERVAALLEEKGRDIWISTFHSACVRMLRRFGASLGYEPNFTIYDTDDQKRVMRDVCKRLNIDPKQLPPKQILSLISSAKNELISPAEYREHAGRGMYKDVARAYEAYQETLFKNNALDFDDLLMKTVEMLRTDHIALAHYQNRFEYILVDEYQDTNTAQFELIRLLATHINEEGEPEHNLCVVGDDDQSIYRFRGANVRNILDFESNYPDATVIKLEQNYRSTKRILEAANSVIVNNAGRKSKALWCDNEKGEPIPVTEYPTDLAEATATAAAIDRAVSEGNGSYRDYAILYRTNAQSRAFEEQLIFRNIPYKIVGGTNFYERLEVRDMLAYLRVIDCADPIAVKRIINVPKRGIGDTTLTNVDDYSFIKDIPLYEALRNAKEIPGISSRTAGQIAGFVDVIEGLRAGLSNPKESLAKLIDNILEATNYEDDLREQDPDKADDRMENVRELKNKIVQYVQSSETPTLSEFLAEVALVADIDSLDGADDYVVLMTLHSAKGLEFDHVFIGGLEEGLFPSQMALDADDQNSFDENLEEERRLMYVGITRARKTLSLSYATRRLMRGEAQYNRPSRFLGELPRELITRRTAPSSGGWDDRYSTAKRGSLGSYLAGQGRSSYSDRSGGSSYGSQGNSYGGRSYGSQGSSYGNQGSSYGGRSHRGSEGSFLEDLLDDSRYSSKPTSGSGSPYSSAGGTYKSPYSKPSTGSYKSPYSGSKSSGRSGGSTASAPAGAPDYKVGDRVRHVKFGIGTVTALTPGTLDYNVTVEFPSGVKEMLASFAKLVRVD